MSDITLYHYWRSSCSWRVRWALIYKGIDFKEVLVDLRKGEQFDSAYKAINPSASVPCLKTQHEIITDSWAIIEWLEERYPLPSLLPNDPSSRAKVREVCGSISSIQAAQNLKILKRHSADPAKQALWAKSIIADGFEGLERKLQTSAGSYCFGGQLTMADLFLVPQVYNGLRFHVSMQAFPTIMSLYQKLRKLPHCLASAPENQTGAQSS